MKMCTLMILTFLLLSVSNNPMIMILIITFQTISYGLLMVHTMKLTFTPLIFILIFLGGLLIIFMYMVSISPILQFKLKEKIFLLITLISLFSFWMNPSMDFSNTITLTLNSHFLEIKSFFNLYNPILYWSTIFITLFLILMLLLIVKILKLNQMPLRKK